MLEAPDRMKCLRHHNLPLCALIVPTRQWGNWGKAEANDLPRSEPLPPNQHPPGRCPSYTVAVVSLLCLKSGVTFWWEETSWRQQSGFRPPLPQILFGMAFLSFVSPDLHSIRYFSLNWRALRRTPCCPALTIQWPSTSPGPRGQDPASHKLPTLLRLGQPPLSAPHRAGSPGPHTRHARLPDSGCSEQTGGASKAAFTAWGQGEAEQ